LDQAVTLPLKSNVLLEFKYIIYSQDASTGDQYDRFEVYVNDQLVFHDGNQVNSGLDCDVWWRVPSPQNPGNNGEVSGWATGTVNLSAYAGQTVRLSFRNYSRFDGWYNTYTYLDDVAILILD
jgi:bacillopeptidase F (M6 metalloprotease family)